jgi:capsule polysaccharide export protein KpsE/RkpR
MNAPLPLYVTDIARRDAASEARRIRQDSLRAARAVVRKYKVRGHQELYQALTNIQANCECEFDSLGKEYADRLLELITDLDAEMTTTLEPELIGHDKRGEYDNQTVGVRHRNYGG